MESQNKQKGWTVDKIHGYISNVELCHTPDGFVHVYHNYSSRYEQVNNDGQMPLSNEHAWIFDDEQNLIEWLNTEMGRCSSKLQHGLAYLSSSNEACKLINESKWPDNFVVGYVPKSFRHYEKYCCHLDATQYSVKNVIASAEHRLAAPLSTFSKVWLSISKQYNDEIAIMIAVSTIEHKAYFKQHLMHDHHIRSAIEYAMNSQCPGVEYHLNTYRNPRFLWGDDKYMVNMLGKDFDSRFIKAVGKNMITKISSGVQRKPPMQKSSACAYLVSSSKIDSIPVQYRDSTIALPYSRSSNKCYVVNAPVEIMVWARPDDNIIVDTHFVSGSVTPTNFNTSVNILDHFI